MNELFSRFFFPSHLFFTYPNGGDDDVYCLVTIYEAFILCPSHSDELTCAINLLALDFYSHVSHCSVNYSPHLLDKLMVRQYDFIGTTWMSKVDPPAVLNLTLKLKPLFLTAYAVRGFMRFSTVVSLNSSHCVEFVHFYFSVSCILDKCYGMVLLNLPFCSKTSNI